MDHQFSAPPLALLTLLFSTLLSHAEEPNLTTRPSENGEPTEVRIQAILIDLETIDGAAQNFTANFAYAARWSDHRLRHDGTEDESVPLDKIWHPRIQIVNQQGLQKTFPEEARISPEGDVTAVQRFWGQFSQPLALQNFPFDEQKLHIELVGSGHRDGAVTFVDDPAYPSGVAQSLSISDWNLLGWNAEPSDLALSISGRNLPAFDLSFEVQRNFRYHFVNFILPLILIICMSWVVFWLDPKTAAPRISVAVTAMLTLIAYRFAAATSLPKIGYLTRMDWFILGSSILVFVSLLEVVVTSKLATEERLDAANKINRRMRIIAPITFALILLFSLVL
ncbi:MAG: hypothetical protein AAGD22_06425 [Verrucomicrobiota bacterium]